MTIKEIYNLAVQKGIEADFRPRAQIEKNLERKREKFAKLSADEKKGFDQESLMNPYSDTRILHIADDKEIKKVLVGIDVEPSEILLAKQLGDIDLVISHHPIGRALADLHDVMELQADKLEASGVPIHISESMLKEKMGEVFRSINPRNMWRTIDTARLLGVNLMCLHTVADNLTEKFVEAKVQAAKPQRVEDILTMLKDIGEFQEAILKGIGPRIFSGSAENRCGKVFVGMTGGTEPPAKLYEKISHAGIGTIVDMHVSEEHKKEAEAARLNIVVTGHMPSDSIGMNLIADDLAKQGIEIVPFSGFIRISRLIGGQARA